MFTLVQLPLFTSPDDPITLPTGGALLYVMADSVQVLSLTPRVSYPPVKELLA